MTSVKISRFFLLKLSFIDVLVDNIGAAVVLSCGAALLVSPCGAAVDDCCVAAELVSLTVIKFVKTTVIYSN